MLSQQKQRLQPSETSAKRVATDWRPTWKLSCSCIRRCRQKELCQAPLPRAAWMKTASNRYRPSINFRSQLQGLAEAEGYRAVAVCLTAEQVNVQLPSVDTWTAAYIANGVCCCRSWKQWPCWFLRCLKQRGEPLCPPFCSRPCKPCNRPCRCSSRKLTSLMGQLHLLRTPSPPSKSWPCSTGSHRF